MAIKKTYGKIIYTTKVVSRRRSINNITTNALFSPTCAISNTIDGSLDNEAPLTKGVYRIVNAQPHVSIKLKNIFPHISKTSIPPYDFEDSPQTCFDLLWFMERYPLEISNEDIKRLRSGKQVQIDSINEIESILLPDYVPSPASLNDGEVAREYQLKGAEVFLKLKRLLLGDEVGLGKTLTAILSFLPIQNRPIAVVVQAHLPRQWAEQVKRFTGLSVHVVKTRKAYDLPKADVYIFKYTSLSGWTNIFATGFFKLACFDEVQELRHRGTDKYDSSKVLSNNVEYCLGMSGTPIYNYGNEIFNVLDCINDGCLGSEYDFTREWTTDGKRVGDPQALGAFLRDNLLFIRRTRADVGRQLPPVNKIIYTIDCDEDVMDKDLALAKQLAIKVVSGSFVERGEASRELNALIRHATGVSKAKNAAAYIKLILESGEPVLVAAWHRDVYEILMHELAEYNPVMYTGSESASQKEKTKQAFISGESKCMLISLRSGIGLDGLQHVCKYVVFAELDFSPQVHSQVIGRIDRDGSVNEVTAVFLVSDSGSDPVVIDIIGLKSSQSHGIVDPLGMVADQHSDDSIIKVLAQQYLNKKK